MEVVVVVVGRRLRMSLKKLTSKAVAAGGRNGLFLVSLSLNYADADADARPEKKLEHGRQHD